MTLAINRERLARCLEQMAQIGTVEGEPGRTRLALSPEDGQARRQLVDWFDEMGLEIRIDGIGNIFGLRPGTEEPTSPVIAGSHLDTVVHAGAYDGVLGVLGALEALRTFDDLGIRTLRTLGVACFTNEEGARFQPDMMGSMVLGEALDLEKARSCRDDAGITVGKELQNLGFAGNDRVCPGAYLELHVEQGPVLDRMNRAIGVVEGVQGIAWWHGTFSGQANHAGTTPIEMRRDALLAASELNMALRALALEIGKGTVSTMGRLRPEPDVINVIPSKAHFTLDFRHYREELFDEGRQRIPSLVKEIALRHGVNFTLESAAHARPVHFAPKMVDMVERNARKRGFPSLRLPSGAGHDAQFMAAICPATMIFVPSQGGISHSPEEQTTLDDAAQGVDLLADCLLELAGRA